MATTRIMPLHVGKGRTESRAISDIIDYVANPKKTDNGRLITGYACDSRTADAEFLLAKRQYIAATGRVRGADDVIAYHVRQSFRPGEITPEEANRLGVEFAKRFTKGNHAFVVCTHIDKSHIHNHIIWSSVSLEYDRKFRNFWGSTKAVRRLSDTICIENGLSIVENPNPHGKSYNKWLGDQAKPSHRELLRVAIDNALSQSPANFEELLKLLQESGCEVSKRGKSYRLKLPGWGKAARMDSLGEGYGLEDLQAVLSGKKAHIPRNQAAFLHELVALFISSGEFYYIHLFFKGLPKFIHIGISLDVRITGNASGFIHSIKRALAVAGQLNIKRKSSSENTLMKEQINCTGHIKTEVLKKICSLFFNICIDSDLSRCCSHIITAFRFYYIQFSLHCQPNHRFFRDN